MIGLSQIQLCHVTFPRGWVFVLHHICQCWLWPLDQLSLIGFLRKRDLTFLNLFHQLTRDHQIRYPELMEQSECVNSAAYFSLNNQISLHYREFIFLAVISVIFTTQFSGAHSQDEQIKARTSLGLYWTRKWMKTLSLFNQICPYFHWKMLLCLRSLFSACSWGQLCLCLCYSAHWFDEFMLFFSCLASVALSVMILGARKWTFDFWVNSAGMCLVIGVTVVCRDVGFRDKIKSHSTWISCHSGIPGGKL